MKKQWTMPEIKYLREAYPVVPNKVLAKALSVTTDQVRQAAYRNGISKTVKAPEGFEGIWEHIEAIRAEIEK